MEQTRTFYERTHSEQVVLDIGQDIGALVVYTGGEMRGREIEVSMVGCETKRTHISILERRVNGRIIYAGVFAALPSGDYTIWMEPASEVTVRGGHVAEVDCCTCTNIYAPYAYASRPTSVDAPDASQSTPNEALRDLLPPRYRDGRPVSYAPMGSAPMRYDDDGQVAWNEMWTSFCDLALAGGPPHRDTLLEPVDPQEARANPQAYERAIAEIERGLRLVTGLPVVHSEKLGWIGVRCESEEMALWLLRAIIVENVCVRREGVVLYLPAGPSFLLEKEIKNVVTVVAKTNHYWQEHLRSRL